MTRPDPGAGAVVAGVIVLAGAFQVAGELAK